MRPFAITAMVLLTAAGGAVVAGGASRVAGKAGANRAPAASSGERHARDLDIAFYEERVSRDPQGSINMAQLAGLYLQRARDTASHADYARAEDWAWRSLDASPRRNGRARLVLASSLLAEHKFAEALAAARELAASEPDVAAYRAMFGETELEMGDYAGARETFEALEKEGADFAVAPRIARWYELTGRTEDALRVLRAASREAALRPGMPAEQLAWFHLRTGDVLMRAGRLVEARTEYEAGLRGRPDDHRLMTSLGRLEFLEDHAARGAALAERAAAIHEDAATLALLADCRERAGDPRGAARARGKLEALVSPRPGPFERAWYAYALDHDLRVAETLTILKTEIAVRPDAGGWDLLAWADHRTGDDQAAAAAMTHALLVGSHDAMMEYHAGVIAEATGDPSTARQHLEAALAASPHFHPQFAADARARLAAIAHPAS